MFAGSTLKRLPCPSRPRSAHYAVAATLFLILGFHVGVWAVQISAVAAYLKVSLAELGALLSIPAVAGLGTLLAGGHLADTFGRKPWLLTGLGGTAVASSCLAGSTP